MSAPVAKRVFLLDTNVLFGFSWWLPINLNSIFWDKLGAALKNGDWVLLDVVAGEVIYDPELRNWCDQQQQSQLVTAIDGTHRNRGIAINNQYQIIDQVSQKSTVDTYLIAYAEANNLVVFSQERFRRDVSKPYKIPDVCKILKIDRISDPLEFLTAIGYQN